LTLPKFCPTQSVPVNKIKFLNDTDKAGGKFLQSALMAIIEKLAGDGDKLISPDEEEKVKKLKGKDKAQKRRHARRPFRRFAAEIRDAFWNGTKKRLTFGRELINTNRIGKGQSSDERAYGNAAERENKARARRTGFARAVSRFARENDFSRKVSRSRSAVWESTITSVFRLKKR
jgi:hypothetical protein